MNWRTYDCDFCPHLIESRSKVVVATPCRQHGLLVIGEAPGTDEDTHGIGFVGRAGKILRGLLRDNNLSCIDYGVANICRCLPLRNDKKTIRPPTSDEIGRCMPYLESLIRDVKPKVILAVGAGTAAKAFFGTDGVNEQLAIGCKYGWRAKDIRKLAPKGLQNVLKDVTYIVSMPHTSPANSREEHKLLAKGQVRLAADLFHEKAAKPRSRNTKPPAAL